MNRPARPTRREPRRTGYSLLEILLAITIIAVIASVATRRYGGHLRRSEQARFIADVQVYLQAAQMYHMDTGDYLEDSSSGAFPNGWDEYADKNKWEAGTPLGGVWDFEKDSWVTSGFGVHFYKKPGRKGDAYMREIDAAIDDGNLSTGSFRKLASDRYYYVLEP